jgi:hypothetical protein
MRLFVFAVLAFFSVGQSSQPSAPTPVKSTHTHQGKSESKQEKTSASDETDRELTTAIKQLVAEIHARNQQQSGAPHNNEPSPDWWGRASTILITLFTGALAYLAYLQWTAMHRQANIYDRQADIYDRQAGIAETQSTIASEQLAITKAAEARHDTEKMAETIEGIRERRRSDGRYSEQLELARENTAIAKQAADAAASNAKALMNAERPWLVPKIVRIVKQVSNIPEADGGRTYRNVTYFGFWIRNVGRTPAQIVAVRGDPRLSYEGIDGGFTDPPDYGLPVVFKHVRLLAPGDKWRTDDNLDIWPLFSLDATIEKDIKAHKVHYIFKGVILYYDIFDRNTIHETRFCYTYLEAMDDWYPSGPPDHTKYT